MKAGPEASRSHDRVAMALAAAAAACLLLCFFNQWLLFGILCWLIMVLHLAVGYGRQRRRKEILYTMGGLFAVYCVLLVWIAAVDQPEGELRLLGGLPLGSALLVYGIWPIGTVSGILYGLVFDRSVLPEEKLQKFLSEFSQKPPKQ